MAWRGGGRGYGAGRGAPWTTHLGELPQLPPPPPGGFRIVALVDRNAGLESTISPWFARAPFIAIVDVYGGRVVSLNIVANPLAARAGGGPGGGGVGAAIATWIQSIGASIVITSQMGPGAASRLQAMGIRVVFKAPGTTLRQALRELGIVC